MVLSFAVAGGGISAAAAIPPTTSPVHKPAPPKSSIVATVKTAPASAIVPQKTPASLPPIQAVAPPPMWSVAYAPDGAHLAIGTYRRVLFFDTKTGDKTGDYVISSEAIRTLAYSPDGKLLAAGTGVPSRSGSVMLLDPATGTVVRTVGGHYDTVEDVAWETGGLILTAANDETVGINDSASGKSVATLTEHIGRCLSVAVPTKTDSDNGGDIFATGGADKAVKIWDAKLHRVVVNFDQATGPIWCLTALPHPGTFVAGSDDGKLRIFQVRADGARRSNAPADEPDPRTGYMAREQTASQGAVYAVATAPDYSHIISGGADGKVIVWPSDIGYRQKELTDAKRDVWGVAVAPDSKQFAASSLDGRTRIYDLKTNALVMTLDVDGIAPVPTAGPPGRIYGPPAPKVDAAAPVTAIPAAASPKLPSGTVTPPKAKTPPAPATTPPAAKKPMPVTPARMTMR